jgi:hypothetical protein
VCIERKIIKQEKRKKGGDNVNAVVARYTQRSSKQTNESDIVEKHRIHVLAVACPFFFSFHIKKKKERR